MVYFGVSAVVLSWTRHFGGAAYDFNIAEPRNGFCGLYNNGFCCVV